MFPSSRGLHWPTRKQAVSSTSIFHAVALNGAMTNVLMIGLGGARSRRRALLPWSDGRDVEIDPVVLKVAEDFSASANAAAASVISTQGVSRRSRRQYDAVLVDAYVGGGMAPRFHIISPRRSSSGLSTTACSPTASSLYNCIGVWNNKADLVGAIYRTMKSVFPQVYLFPARESWNVVLVGTHSAEAKRAHELWPNAMPAWQSGRMRLPTFFQRLGVLRVAPPSSSINSPLLADDYAPVDGLLGGMRPTVISHASRGTVTG